MTSTEHRPNGGPMPAPAWLNPAPSAAPSAAPWPGPAAWPTGAPVPPVPPSGMRWGWIVIGVVGAILAVTLIGVIASAQRTMTVQGTVTLHMGNLLTSGSSCSGANFYSWLDAGTAVTISDAHGTIVGVTSLSTGTAEASGSSYSSYADTCVFPFTLTDVPSGDEFYRVGVGNTAGNGVPFSVEQLRMDGAGISIGQ